MFGGTFVLSALQTMVHIITVYLTHLQNNTPTAIMIVVIYLLYPYWLRDRTVSVDASHSRKIS
jgi:hypothetical protein